MRPGAAPHWGRSEDGDCGWADRSDSRTFPGPLAVSEACAASGVSVIVSQQASATAAAEKLKRVSVNKMLETL